MVQQDVSQGASGFLDSGTDAVSEDQKVLDAEQIGGSTTQTVTREDYDALTRQNINLSAELRGLQGSLDKTAQIVRQMEERDSARSTADLLFDIPEEQRPVFEHLTKTIDELKTRIGDNGAARPQAQSASVSVTPELKEFVRQSGLSPDDPRIDYSVMTNPNINEWERVDTLMAGIKALSSPASTTPVITPETARPPSTNSVPAGQSAYSDADAVLEAMLRDELTYEEGASALKRFDFPF